MKWIYSAIVVICIVTFSVGYSISKGQIFCASTAQNVGCTIIAGKTEVDNHKPSALYYKYNAWNGEQVNCISNRCETQVMLYNETGGS